MNAIEVCGLSKSYPGFTLSDISFALPEGCILGLVGENGAGKSTLIRLIMDATGRDAGTVRVLDTEVTDPAFTRVRGDIGVVLDDARLPETLNPRQLGRVFAGLYDRWDGAVYGDYLRRLELPETKKVKDFSRGMKMKLALALALSHDARLLVLDEPTGGLDPVVRDEILDILEDFTRREDRSVLISSHIVSDLEKLCDYVAFLHRGKLLLFEEKDRLLEEYAMARVTEAELSALPPEAVRGTRRGKYGAEALVERRLVPAGVSLEKPTLEDIIVFFARGERE